MPAIVAFENWAREFVAADAGRRRALLTQVESLANERREAMAELIRHDPRQALARALPYGTRKQLPATVAALIEQPLSERGTIRPHIDYLRGEEHPEQCRVDGVEIEIEQGRRKKTYRAFTWGKRAHSGIHHGAFLHGIRAGDVVALAADAGRTITDPQEILDLTAEGKVIASGRCDFCGQAVAAGSTCVLEHGDQYFAYCGVAHADAFNRTLTEAQALLLPGGGGGGAMGAGGGGVAGNPPDQLPPAVGPNATQGLKKLLYIRVTYADDPIVPQTDDSARATAEANNRFYNLGSYNTVWWETTVTPVIRLPQRKTYYGDSGTLVSDALAGAAALGYFASDYYMYYVLTTSMPQFKFGGISSGILNASPGAISHELGHNFGLPHANFYQPEGRKPGPTNNTPFPVDPDSILGHNDINAPVGRGAAPTSLGDPTAEPVYEYGNPHDEMGGGGQFSTMFKYVLDWLPLSYLALPTESSTNRIYAYDVVSLTTGRTYAVVLRKHESAQYWLSFRQGINNNRFFANGIEVTLNMNGNLLIDTTPDSALGRRDAALVVGRTFHDSQAGLHITPVAISNDANATNKWIDVVIQRGDFPDNEAPTLSIAADGTAVDVGASVNFTAMALDADGDALAYYWDFGDFTFGTNGAAQTKTYTAAGVYVVRCEVSDMKGGIASRHVVITVGTPNTYTISGRVTDPNGNGVQGVRVHNSRPRPSDTSANIDINSYSYRYSYTDSDGYYVIGNVPPGTYTNRAWIYGYRTVPQNFTDPLVVSDGNTAGFNFLATPIPRVKIASIIHATEPGEDGVTPEEEGHFIVTRNDDLSEDLVVRFQGIGLTAANFTSDNATVLFDERRFIMPAGLPSVDLRYTPEDNLVGSGNGLVGLRLLLATNDIRVVTVLSNVLITNANNFITTNTVFVSRTNRLEIPGWELRPSGPAEALTWFQTDPTYVLDQAEGFIEVVDDDEAAKPEIAVNVLDSYALESRPDNATLLITRNNAPLTNALTVRYALSGVASNGLDYAALSGSLTFAPGQAYVLLYVQAVNDLFVEGNEVGTLTILPDGAYNVAGDGAAQFMIVDDDLPLVNIFASDSRAARGGADGRITFSRTGTLSEDLAVNYLVGGTAAPGVDYTPLAGTVVIPAGQLSVDVPVVAVATSTSSLPRTVTVQISDATTYNIYSDNTATVTLIDGALQTVSISGGADINESGGSTTFTITRTGPTNSSLTVYFDVGGTAWEGIDYTAIGTNVVIPAGASTATISLSGINDNARELGRVTGQESIIIALREGTNYLLSGTTARSIRINDDEGDTSLPAVGFMLGSSSVREDAGSASIFVRVTANPATNKPIDLLYRVTAGTAVPNVNYIPDFGPLGTTGMLHFEHVTDPDPPSIISEVEGSIVEISVPLLNDGVSTANRTLTLTLMNPNGYQTNISRVTNNNVVYTNTVITRIPTNAYLGPSLSHTLTILDVGTSLVTITPSTEIAYEAGSQPVRFTVTRSGATNAPLTVAFAVRGDGANGSDYTLSTNGTLTIPAGTNSVVLTMTPRNDATEETAETMTVSLLERPGYGLGNPASATVLLVSDDGTIQFLLADNRVAESSGIASVPVVRSGNTNIAVSVSFVVSNGTANAGSDYVVTNGTLTFAPGETLKSFDVALLDDTDVEPDENVVLALFNASGGIPLGGQKTATLTIVNDDTDFDFSVATYRANENEGAGRVEIVRSGLVSAAQSVTFTATNATAGPADFVATNIVVDFAPGQTNAIVSVALLDDASFEGDENIALSLANPTGGAAVGALSLATLAVIDDECRVELGATQFFAREHSNFVSIVVRRVGGSVNPISVNVSTADGTAVASNDYIGGTFTVTFSGDRFEADTNGTGQVSFVPGETTKELVISLIDDDEGEGNEDFTVTLSDPAVLNSAPASSVTLGSNTVASVTIIDNETPGNVDYDYSSGSGPNGPVRALALQYDNKTVIGGDFTLVDGFSFGRIARIHPTGVFDAGFNPGAGADGSILALASGVDGKVYLGGDFSKVNNTNRLRVARLAADGKLDLSFSNTVNGTIRAIALQTNGQVLIGGDFTAVGGLPRNRLARLNSDGSLDGSFNPNLNAAVNAIVVQADGTILVGGSFNLVGLTNRSSLVRLNVDGGIDPNFVIGSGFTGNVNALAIQPDGRILVGGNFSAYNGAPRNGVVRLMPSGALDLTFTTGAGANGAVNTIGVTSTGKIFIGGDFTTYNGVLVNRVARLKANGALDLLFIAGAGANASVRASLTQPDSAIVIGGDFTEVHGVTRTYLARLHGDEKSSLAGIEVASAAADEAAGTLAVNLVRTGNTNGSVTLTVGTFNLSATNGVDYLGVTNTVTFDPGQTSAVVSITILDDTLIEGDEAIGLSITATAANVDLSAVASAIATILDNEKAIQFASANFLASEGSTNAVITLERAGGLAGTVSAVVTTADGTATANADYLPLSATVTFGPGESNATVLVPLLDDFAGERAETVLLSLSAPVGAILGAPSEATLTIVDDDFSLGVTTRSNTTPITILDAQPAAPYPSSIVVSNLTGVLSRVEVQFVGLRHAFPSDIDALLVGPSGQSVLLMSDAGAAFPVTNVTLTFSDYASTALASNAALVTSTNRPTDFNPADSFFAPAPSGPYGTALSTFVGTMANGTWSLYVLDDRGGDVGVISNGWRLVLTTVDLNKVADLSVAGSMSPATASSGEVVVYSFVVSNAGPNAATGIVLSNPIPTGVAVLSAYASQGDCSISNGFVVCGLDFLAVEQTAVVEMKVIHGLGGSTTNVAIVRASEPDVSVTNNVARVISTITPGTTAELLVTLKDSPDPILQGEPVVYSITVSNRGPLNATGVMLTDYLPENGEFITASASQGTLSNTGPTIVFSLGTVPAGATATATVLVRPRTAGFLTNTAVAIANENDLTENTVTEVTAVSAAANLVLSMVDTSDPVGVNQAFGYNLLVYNAGPGVADNVAVFDILPAQFDFVSVNSSQGSNFVSGGAIILQLGTIAPGSSATATIVARATISGLYTNFAAVVSSQEDPDPANNSASEKTQVFQLITGSTNGGIQITRTTNAAQLAALVTGSGSTGIRVKNTRLQAHQIGESGPASSGVYTLSTSPSTYGLRSPGVVLSTGDVLAYETGTNRFTSTTTSYGRRATTPQEALLDPITGAGTNNFTHNDVTQLDIEFDMLPGFSQVQFKVVFGSEEYPVFVGSSFIDGFGIFLNGTNIAFSGGKPVNINHPDFKDIRGTELNGVLAPGGNPVVQFTATVAPGSSNNTLTFIVADTTDTAYDTTVFITSLEGGLAPNADLLIAGKALPDPIQLGTNFTYYLAVTNFGPDTATNTVVTDVLPAGLIFNSATTSQGSYTVSNGVVTFNLGRMFRFIGANMSINVTPQNAGRYTNLVYVASELADLQSSNNTALVVNTVTDPNAFVAIAELILADGGPALTYPSVLNVSGFNGLVGAVSVTLNNLSHTFPADLDVLLVGPQGQRAILMSDAGAGNDLNDVTLRFEDAAADLLPAAGQIVSGVYKPTNIGGGDTFPAPAPPGPYGDALSVFSGTDPNGDWKLYVVDDQGSDAGFLFGGWRLSFTTGGSVALTAGRSGNDVVLSWPASATGYTVVSAPDANGPWSPATGTLTSANGRFVFTVQTTAQRLFFRLVKP